MLADILFDFIPYVLRGKAGPVWAIGDHGVIGIGQANNAGEERDVRTRQPIRISPAVPSFMVMADRPGNGRRKRQRLDEMDPLDRVLLEVPTLGLGQVDVFENMIGDADFADIVKKG